MFGLMAMIGKFFEALFAPSKGGRPGRDYWE